MLALTNSPSARVCEIQISATAHLLSRCGAKKPPVKIGSRHTGGFLRVLCRSPPAFSPSLDRWQPHKHNMRIVILSWNSLLSKLTGACFQGLAKAPWLLRPGNSEAALF